MVVVREPLTEETLAWLLGGDVAVQFQTYRDLVGDERPELQQRIASESDARVIDLLRGLDVLRGAGTAYDDRLDAAVDVLHRRQRPDGRWAAAAQYPGQVHLAYPRAGEPNRWITLRTLRVLAWAAS